MKNEMLQLIVKPRLEEVLHCTHLAASHALRVCVFCSMRPFPRWASRKECNSDWCQHLLNEHYPLTQLLQQAPAVALLPKVHISSTFVTAMHAVNRVELPLHSV